MEGSAMKKFAAIEGLRGWLAWAVVFSHLAYFSNLSVKGLGSALKAAGLPAVLLFLMISGFVITHLVVERPEPYGVYLLRRFMRIFPLFVVTCVIGFFTSDLQVSLLSHISDSADPQFTTLLADIARSNHDFFLLHFLAHATLLHGAISDTVLPFSQYAFNMPAWSLSLEWQFYLVAPAIVTVARWPRAMICAAVMIAIAEIAFRHRFFGSFEQPSFLLAVAGYFAVGVASRLAYPSIAGTIRHPAVILSIVIVLLPLLDSWGVPLLIWGLIIAGLALHASAQTSPFARAYRVALESRIAVYFGSRSYSTYLCHLQIISIAYWLRLSLFSTEPTFLGLSVLTVPLTIIAAELLYHWVERPGIALGSRLARGSMQATGNFGRKSALMQ